MKDKNFTLENKVFFYLFLLLVLYLSYKVLSPLISIVVLAFITALFFDPIKKYLYEKLGERNNLSSSITMLIITITFIIPIAFIFILTTFQVVQLQEEFSNLINGTNLSLDDSIENANQVIERFDFIEYEITENKVIDYFNQGLNRVGQFMLNTVVAIGSNSVKVFTNVLTYIFLLYVFLQSKDEVIKRIERLSPLDDDIDELYIQRIIKMSKAMVQGTFVISLVQSGVTLLVMYFVGVEYLFFIFMLMAFFGVIPFVGTQIVSIPVGIVMLLTGNVIAGIAILVTAFLVGFIDNFLRPMLVPEEAELHPALTLLGLLGGVQIFGVMGFIYGPVIMIIFSTTMQIYLKHYR